MTLRSVALVVWLGLALQTPVQDAWFAEDKLKHLFTSFAVTSLSASGARALGVERDQSLFIGVAVGTGSGLYKEVDDRRKGSIFSFRDLVWDAIGIGGAFLLLDLAR